MITNDKFVDFIFLEISYHTIGNQLFSQEKHKKQKQFKYNYRSLSTCGDVARFITSVVDALCRVWCMSGLVQIDVSMPDMCIPRIWYGTHHKASVLKVHSK